jgi:hypothetical protein
MKKLLLLAALLGTAASAFAQGQVAFRNSASTNFYLWTNNAVGGQSNLMSGTSAYRIGLYASTTPGATEGSLSLVGLATNSTALAGRFLGPSPYLLPGIAGGTPIVFQIRAWSFAGGLSYEEALNAAALDPLNIALGTSTLGTVTPSANPAPPADLFGTSAGLIQGFLIKPVPEPSSIALGLLGLGAIALFRRRK